MTNLNFVILRMECCNQYKDTPCRVALIGIKDSIIAEKKEFLINPGDEPFEFLASGTQLSQLKDKSSFADNWSEIEAFIRNYPLVVSTADGYDSDVLFNAVRKSYISCKPIPYVTAKNICRKSVRTYSFTFDFLCDLLNVVPIDRMPVSLAVNWAEIIINACKDIEDDGLISFCEKQKIVLGSISSDGYDKGYIKRVYKSKKGGESDFDGSTFDESHPFYDQNVVFTGTLQHFSRDESQNHVMRIGGHCPSGLTKSTNYLVVGVQSPAQVGPDGLSGKQKKAIKYKEEGAEIEILSEADFIDLMGLQDLIDWRKYVDDTYGDPMKFFKM